MNTGIKDKTGRPIKVGDLLTHQEVKERFLPYTVKFGKHIDIAEAGFTTHTNIGFFLEDAEGGQVGLLNEELLINWDNFEIID